MNIAEILKNCPKGTKLYSPLFGECKLIHVDCISNSAYPITIKTEHDEHSFTKDGLFYKNYTNSECLLFPSKDNRDWSTFKVNKEKELPKSWEEFCKTHPRKANEVCFSNIGEIGYVNYTAGFKRNKFWDRSILPSKELAEAMLALCQLIQLRDCYNDDWIPDWTNDCSYKYCLEVTKNEIITCMYCVTSRILVFKTKELCDEFLKNFKDLLEVAKPLL